MAKNALWGYVHSGSDYSFQVLWPVLVYIFKDDGVKDDLIEENAISERKEVAGTLQMLENKGVSRIFGLRSEGIIRE
jgi:hypothetical protein